MDIYCYEPVELSVSMRRLWTTARVSTVIRVRIGRGLSAEPRNHASLTLFRISDSTFLDRQ